MSSPKTKTKLEFAPATKENLKFKMTLQGPSGSGKTFTALTMAKHLGGRTAIIDTERGKSQFYSDEFEFDVMALKDFHPNNLLQALAMAEEAGYNNLIIDSYSHFWMGLNGILQQVDLAAARFRDNTFRAWKELTPVMLKQFDALLDADMNIILTLRTKSKYMEIEENGRKKIQKVGLDAVQKDDFEFEFDLNCEMDMNNTLIVNKTRFRTITEKVWPLPGKQFVDAMKAWRSTGVNRESGASMAEKFVAKVTNDYSEATDDLKQFEPEEQVAPASLTLSSDLPPAKMKEDSSRLLTDPEVRTLWAHAQSCGHDSKSAQDILRKHGYTSFREIILADKQKLEQVFSDPSILDGLHPDYQDEV